MPPQTDHATRKLRAAAAHDLKNGLQVGKGELAGYSLDALHRADANAGPDTGNPWHRRVQQEIRAREGRRGWLRDQGAGLVVGIVAGTVAGVLATLIVTTWL